MDSWAEEKRALVATIRRQERDAAKLARRFKMLQHTLVEQQALLDRYQRALQQQQQQQQQSDGGGGGGNARHTVPLADADETQSTVALTNGMANGGGGGEGVASRVASEQNVSTRGEKEVEPAGTEDEEARHEDSATCLSPPLAAVEATPPPPLALSDAPTTATLAPPTVPPVAQALSELKQCQPAQSSAWTIKSKEVAVKASTSSRDEALWTQRRKPELSNVSLVSKAAEAPHPSRPPLPSNLAAAPVTKRPRPAQAKWADVKKQRFVTVPTPSTGQAAASTSSGNKENRQFAHVEVVRNREARAALPAHDCVECAKYYAALGDMVTAEQAAEHKRACSRHRARYQPYETPDDFWRLSFPDSEPTT